MSHRERHTPDEAMPLSDRVGQGLTHGPPSNGSLWDEWYPRASPAQRLEALRRASQQGVVFAHQLAVPAHAAAPNRSLLSTLLNGQAQELPTLRPDALEVFDADLDDVQREAAARAVSTPDVCLIQGFPGTGKSRLIAEIVLQAAERGEHIVFLAPNAVAVDSVLERLGEHPNLCPLRCLAAEEQPATLSPAVARLTLPERLRCYRETTLPAARAALEAARKAMECRSSEESLWPQLEEAAGQCERIAEELRGLQASLARLDNEEIAWEQADEDNRSQWLGCRRVYTEALERIDNALAGLHAELETTQRKQTQLDNECAALRPLVESRNGRRFWTVTWWRSMMQGSPIERMRDLETRRAEMQAARLRLEEDIAARRDERLEIDTRYAAEFQSLCDRERSRRRRLLDEEIAAVTERLSAANEQGLTLCRTLPQEIAPAELSPLAVQTARTAWQQMCQEQARQADAAGQWLRTVEEGEQTLPRKLAECANVVAGTPAALAKDAQFGDRNGVPAMLFDLLIMDEAHLVSEADFLSAARRARRWVLIGEPRPDGESHSAPRKETRSASPRLGFFDRIWQHLHADPRRLPFAWKRHEGRLQCRLRDCSADEEKWIETETVVDRPDVALRILTLPRQTPRLVEILFPPGMDIAEAKQFLIGEMEELAVQTRGHALRWSETATEIVLEMAAGGHAESATIDLAPGVCERLARVAGHRGKPDEFDWHTHALTFAVDAGWTRQGAESWVEEKLGLRSLGRTIRLTTPHRLDPLLAHFLSDLLFDGHCPPVETATSAAWPRRAVEFVAVPAAAFEDKRQPAHAGASARGEVSAASGGVSVRAPRLRSFKGGAGLELELSDRRMLDQLPNDLRAVLPPRGLVNYHEASTLVKHLDALFHDESFRSACERWRQQRALPRLESSESPAGRDGSSSRGSPTVAIMALYPAQVELLRQLLRRTPLLAHPDISVEVGLPSAFAQRECLLALVSLTRSHSHRAVPFCEHPHVLTQALTRAASGLILFGDPGTLVRRSQWRGALDHLDEDAARREGRLVARLVQYLQGRGVHSSAFTVQEGCGV